MMESVLPVAVGRSGPPNVRLSLSNRPENVALVRQMLAGVAEAIGLDGNDLNDISTAATEACNNVVLHAYGGAEGPLEIDVHAGPEAVEVVVRDRGSGIRAPLAGSQEASGLGLAVIQALAGRAEFSDAAEQGTEVRMAFPAPPVAVLDSFPDDGLELPAIIDTELAGAMEMSIAPPALARTILPRLLTVFAARAHFTTDRIGDVQLVADALAANAPGSITGSHLNLGILVEPRTLELRIAPLRLGSAKQLVEDSAVGGLAPVIERLTNEQNIATLDAASRAEMLALRLSDRR